MIYDQRCHFCTNIAFIDNFVMITSLINSNIQNFDRIFGRNVQFYILVMTEKCWLRCCDWRDKYYRQQAVGTMCPAHARRAPPVTTTTSYTPTTASLMRGLWSGITRTIVCWRARVRENVRHPRKYWLLCIMCNVYKGYNQYWVPASHDRIPPSPRSSWGDITPVPREQTDRS